MEEARIIREKILEANPEYQPAAEIEEMEFADIDEAMKYLHRTYYETMTGKAWDGNIY